MDLFDLFCKISIDMSDLESGIEQAKSKVSTFAKDISGLSSTINGIYSGVEDALQPAIDGFKAVESVGKTAGSAITNGLKGFATAATAVGTFGVAAAKTGATFDSSMSQVVATMGYSVEELSDKASDAYQTYQDLRNAAIESGATTVFSATESADALNYMALAGYDAKTSISMLPKVLNLAAAGGIDLASASDMITDSQSALGLSLDETEVMIDQMARTASKSNTSVAQLGEAILTVGGTASYMADGTNEINMVLGVLADNGIKGSEAGTHLRNMLLSLSSPTDNAAATLNSLGVSVFDADGKMRSFSEIFPELNAAMSDLTDQEKLDAFSTLFNTRDIAAATALLNTTTDRWDELGEAILNCKGAAEDMAAVQLDNLQGDVTLLKSAFEGLQIVISDALTPTLREFAQFGSKAMDELRKGFQGEGVSGFMSALSGIVTEGVTMLAQKAPEFASVSLQFITALADGILGAGDQIFTAVYDVSHMLINGFDQWMSENGTKLADIGTDLIIYMLDAFEYAGDIIGKYVGEFIPQIIDVFTQYHEALFTVGINILGAIGQGLTENKEQIQHTISVTINQMVLELQRNAPMIIEGGIALLEALVGAIQENMPLILEAGATIVGELISGIATASPGVQAIIATAVLPHILKIIDTVGKIGGAVSSMVSIVQPLISGIVSFVSSGITAIIGIGSKLMTGIQALWALMLANPITIVIAAVAALVAGFIALWNNCEGFRNFWIGLWDGIKSVVSIAVDAILGFFGGIIDFIGNNWQTILTMIVNPFAGAFKLVYDNCEEFRNFIDNLMENVKELFSAGWEAVKGFFAGAWEGIKSAWSGAKEFFGGIWSSIKETAEAAAKRKAEAMKESWEAVKTAWDAAKGFFSDLWSNIKTTANEAGEKIGGALSSAWDAVKSAWDGAMEFFGGVWDSIKDVFSNAWDAFKDIGGNIVSGIKDGIANAWDSFWSWLSGKVGGIVDGIKSMLGIHSPSTVFADIGENMALGLGEGWDDEYSDIKRKIEGGMNFGTVSVGLVTNGTYNPSQTAQNGPQTGFGGAGNTYVIINSPVAVDAVTAAREWKKTTQRMAMAY